MDNKSLSHVRWKCQYNIVFIPKYIREDTSYEVTDNRHSVTFVTKLDRDRIYKDLFEKPGEL